MEEAQELQYWTRRLERRVFLLAFCGSLAFLLGRFVSLGGDSQRILFNDIANILISVLQSQCVILMLGLMLPMCTKTFYRQGFWLFALSFVWVYVRVTVLKWHDYSHDSTIILGLTLMLPVWLLLWVRAQYREFFRDILFQVSRHIKGITGMDLAEFGGFDNAGLEDGAAGKDQSGSKLIIQNFGAMVEQTNGKRNRMVGLLGLVLSGRFLLSMLGTIGLTGADIVKLKDYHQNFCERVLEAKTKYLERKEAYRRLQKRMEHGAAEDNLLPKQSNEKLMASIEEQLEKRSFEYDVNILVDAAVVFMAQTLSLLLARLHRHSVTRLNIFAGEVLQNVISNPITQRRWRKFMSSTQYLVTKKALDRIETIVTPLPAQIDPTNVFRLLGNVVLVEVLQRNFFQSISRYWIENTSSRITFNRFTRSTMWVYVIIRFGINTGRSFIDDKETRRKKGSDRPLPSNVNVGYNGYEFLDRISKGSAEKEREPATPIRNAHQKGTIVRSGGTNSLVVGDTDERNANTKLTQLVQTGKPDRTPTLTRSSRSFTPDGSRPSRLIHT